MPKKKIKTYKEFEYGMDEIVLNYYVKKFFLDHKFKMRVVRYRPMIMSIINTIIAHIEFSYKKHKLIINDFLRKMLNNKFTGNIKTDLNNFNLLFYNASLSNNKINNNIVYGNTYLSNNLKSVILNLKNNFSIIRKIEFPTVIINFITNSLENNFKEYNPFDDYFVSLSKPGFL
jgi:hypothetical protein